MGTYKSIKILSESVDDEYEGLEEDDEFSDNMTISAIMKLPTVELELWTDAENQEVKIRGENEYLNDFQLFSIIYDNIEIFDDDIKSEYQSNINIFNRRNIVGQELNDLNFSATKIISLYNKTALACGLKTSNNLNAIVGFIGDLVYSIFFAAFNNRWNYNLTESRMSISESINNEYEGLEENDEYKNKTERIFSYGYSVDDDYDGNYGTWWASTNDGERASGTWHTGSWEVHENNTSITDEEWDMILDDPDFWQGPTEDDIHVGIWDGETFYYIMPEDHQHVMPENTEL